MNNMAEKVKGSEQKNQETKKNNKKIVFGVIALVAILALMAGIYLGFKPKTVEGAKSITIEVIDNNQEMTSYKVQTDSLYLRQVMEETEGLTFTGTEGDYGIMIESVNGVTADFNKDGAYWSFYVNGGYCTYGIDTQPVEDGDVFQIKYEVSVGQ